MHIGYWCDIVGQRRCSRSHETGETSEMFGRHLARPATDRHAALESQEGVTTRSEFLSARACQ